MEIDLIKIVKLGLNINEYLTLFKIDKSTNGINFPFTSTVDYLNLLNSKGFINNDNGNLSLTNKGLNIVNPEVNINFDELFNLYPDKTPNRRILRSKNKEIKGKLTKDYKVLKQKYLLRVKDPAFHDSIILATKAMLKDAELRGSENYLQGLEPYINQNGWEKYMNENGEVKNTPKVSNNIEFI